jgi:hypothetical protein
MGEQPVQILIATVQIVVVPGILTIIVLGAALAPRWLSQPVQRRAARIGFWGGLTVTAFLIVLMGAAVKPEPPAVQADAFVWPAISGGVIAAIIGVIVSQGVTATASRRVGGLVFVMSATSSAALCLYLAVPDSRVVVASFVLSALVVLLFLYAVVPELLRSKTRPPIIYQ